MYGTWGPSTHVIDFQCEQNGHANELSISQICPTITLGSGTRTMLAEWRGACGMLIINQSIRFPDETYRLGHACALQV